jgi:hypothetical protein
MRPKPEMLHTLPGILRSTQQQRIRTGRRPHSQLIQRQSLTTSLLDASAGSSCEAEGRNGQLGDGEEAVVVGDGAHDDDGLVLGGVVGALGVGGAYEAGEGDGGAVDAGHEEAAEDDLVEVGVGTTCGLSIDISISAFLRACSA